MNNQTTVLHKFLNGAPSNLQDIVSKLNDILSNRVSLDIDIKWNRLTYATNNDFHHWICGISILKDKVSLVFHFGGLLNDVNHNFTAGTSMFLRKMDYKTTNEINADVITDFLQQAISKLPYFKQHWQELIHKN